MQKSSQPWLLIAMSTDRRGEAMKGAAAELRLNAEVVTEAETLRFRTRLADDLPAALLVDHQLAAQVDQVDLVQLLRRRSHLSDVPIVYFGPQDNEIQAAAYGSGADVYLTLPTAPAVVTAALRHLLARRQSELGLRQTLERLRDFEQAYKESERVKDDLIHMLVHDLKSPISSVIGLLDHSLDMIRGESPVADGGIEAVNERSEERRVGTVREYSVGGALGRARLTDGA